MKSQKSRSKSRGYLTPDISENPDLIQVTRELGWKVTKITKSYASAEDETIALKYDKGRSVLLTYDKKAYTYNKANGGFIGYIEHNVVDKEAIDKYCKNFKNILSNFTNSHIAGHRLIIDDKATSYKKVSLKKIKRENKRKRSK